MCLTSTEVNEVVTNVFNNFLAKYLLGVLDLTSCIKPDFNIIFLIKKGGLMNVCL